MLALTHLPSPHMQHCQLTFAPPAVIDVELAGQQHAEYCRALRGCGLEVRVLEASRRHPDCVFIEDTAIVLDEVAVLASPASETRRAELAGVEPELRRHRPVERIEPPATIEGGDVLRLGRTLLAGLSSRTNQLGIDALRSIAEPLNYRVVAVPVRDCLHLKTACAVLPDGGLLVNEAWIDAAALGQARRIAVPEDEPWGANVLSAGERVLLPQSNTRTTRLLRQLGFSVRPVDISEFVKAEGGVTCLSLILS